MTAIDTEMRLNEPCDAERPIVWSIAASDSGGGAGLQADNLTMHDLGVHCCNIVTAITAQNSVEVSHVTAISIAMLAKQIACLLEDMPPKAIKIGVLANAEQVRWLSLWLSDTFNTYQQNHKISVPIIWDPVMLATTGHALTDLNNKPHIDDYLQLAQHVSLITPNIKEFLLLLNTTTAPKNDEQKQDLLRTFSHSIKTNVLLTGGNTDDAFATDWLAVQNIAHTSPYHQQQMIALRSSTINTLHDHGTGCTFSSAIASSMALGYPMLDAVCIAKAYVSQGLLAGYQVGKGAGVLARKGWPEKLENFPTVLLSQCDNVSPKEPLCFAKVITPLRVYSVTQSLNVLAQILEAGARTVQFRIKDVVDPIELETQIHAAVTLGKKYKAQVFINDHWQLAIQCAAFGVHLGQEDMLTADLAKIAQAGLAVGLSSHGYFELLVAQQLAPSYLAIGHIFPTPTKTMPSKAQGLTKLQRYCTLLKSKVPLVAIGGICAENLAQVHCTGVDDIAVVRAIEQTEDPALSWQHLQQQWESLV